mmetsp:Transcript_6756/g.20476  ORF Transcript_6756/g.20476 Transcript_6756/m.20476 type:complete len:486 (+) Transcript_6756:107-1564(+)
MKGNETEAFGRPNLVTEAELRSYLAMPAEVESKLTAAREAIWLRLGSMRQLLNENEAAVTAYETVLMYNPRNVRATTKIGAILTKTKKYEEAIKCLQNAIKIDPDDGEAWGYLGYCHTMTGNVQEAYDAYCKALSNLRTVTNPDFWYGIGILYDLCGSYDLALDAFLEVLQVGPDETLEDTVIFCVGIIYKEKQNYTLALEYLNQILRVESPPPPLRRADLLLQIAEIYELQNENEKAEDTYRMCLRINPDHVTVLQQYAWLVHLRGNSDEALKLIQESLAKSPSNAHACYLNARINIDKAKYQYAFEALHQALKIDNRNPFYWCTMGILYDKMMQHTDAVDAFSRAIRMNPYVFEVWFNLGSLYARFGQTRDSTDAYERALEISPDDPYAKHALRMLKNDQRIESLPPLFPPTTPSAPALRVPEQKQQAEKLARLQILGMDLSKLVVQVRGRFNVAAPKNEADMNVKDIRHRDQAWQKLLVDAV